MSSHVANTNSAAADPHPLPPPLSTRPIPTPRSHALPPPTAVTPTALLPANPTGMSASSCESHTSAAHYHTPAALWRARACARCWGSGVSVWYPLQESLMTDDRWLMG